MPVATISALRANRPRSAWWRWLAPLLLVFLASCVSGASLGAGSVLRSLDNDSVAASDDAYTHGLNLTWVGPSTERFAKGPVPSAVGAWVDARLFGDDLPVRTVSYSVSQRLFTPSDLSRSEFVEGDQPYAGLLYGSAIFTAQDEHRLIAYTFNAGVVGPSAGGEGTQSWVHDVIGARDPMGWDTQIPDEPLLGLGAERRTRLARFDLGSRLSADVLGGGFAALGNLQTMAALSGAVRLGIHLPDNFHMPAPFLWDESVGMRATTPCTSCWSSYLYAGGALAGIAHTVHHDGPLFRDGPSVDRDRFEARGSIGVATRYRGLLVTVSYELATVPYDDPDGSDLEQFGRLAFSWDF